MTDKDNPFGEMMNIWQENQEAFFKAQTDVADAFRKSMEEMAGQTSPDATNPQAAMAAWNSFIKSWAPQWDPSSFMAQNGMDPKAWQSGNEAFFAMLEPTNWTHYAPDELRNILNMIAQGPRFADLFTPQHDAASAWRESIDYSEAAADLSKIMQDAWTRAYKQYGENHTLEDLQAGNVKGALDAWLAAANAELLETQKSPDFMDAQASPVTCVEWKLRLANVTWRRRGRKPIRCRHEQKLMTLPRSFTNYAEKCGSSNEKWRH